MSRAISCVAATVFCVIALTVTIGHAQPEPTQAVSVQPDDASVAQWVKDILARKCEQTAAPASQAKEPFPDPIEQLLDAWLAYSKFWRYVYYAVSIGTIFFGALATALIDGDVWYRKWKTGAALLVTVVAGISTTFSPYSEHKRFDEAFVVLNATKLSYLTNPNVTICDVGKAVLIGESVIHRGG
jgi:hypothetical protein